MAFRRVRTFVKSTRRFISSFTRLFLIAFAFRKTISINFAMNTNIRIVSISRMKLSVFSNLFSNSSRIFSNSISNSNFSRMIFNTSLNNFFSSKVRWELSYFINKNSISNIEASNELFYIKMEFTFSLHKKILVLFLLFRKLNVIMDLYSDIWRK